MLKKSLIFFYCVQLPKKRLTFYVLKIQRFILFYFLFFSDYVFIQFQFHKVEKKSIKLQQIFVKLFSKYTVKNSTLIVETEYSLRLFSKIQKF